MRAPRARPREDNRNRIVINDLNGVKNGRATVGMETSAALRTYMFLRYNRQPLAPCKGTKMTPASNVTTGTPPDTAPLGLFARIVGVIFSPRQTFASIAAAPRWFGMLAVFLVITAGVTGGFMFTEVGQQAFLDMMEKQGRNAQAMEMMQKLAGYMGYITIGQVLVLTPIVLLILSGLLFVVFTVGMGGNATFKQVFSIVVFSEAIGLVSGILKLPLNYLTRSMTAGTNLGVFFPMLDDTSFLARFFGMVDLFLVWWVAVLAIGFGVLYKRRTGPIAVAFFVIYALIAVGIAAFQAARS